MQLIFDRVRAAPAMDVDYGLGLQNYELGLITTPVRGLAKICGSDQASARSVQLQRYTFLYVGLYVGKLNTRLRCADQYTIFCLNDAARALKSHPKVAIT